MKTVSFARAYRWPTSDTSYEEYPRNWTGDVTDERAKAAHDAGALKGEPAEVDAVKPAETGGKTHKA